MTTKKTSDYVAAPVVVDGETLKRLEVCILVGSGQLKVTEGARRLGISRNRFQSIYHSALGAMIEDLMPKPAGRPKKPESSTLAEENERLRREVAELQKDRAFQEEVITNLADIVKEQAGMVKKSARGRTTKSTTMTAASDDDAKEEPDGERRRRLARALELMARGMKQELAARVAGTSSSSVRRWARRLRAGAPAAKPHRPASQPPPSPELAAGVERRVRDLRGNIGADALRIAVPGVSRRQAEHIKKQTLRALERERKAAAQRVVVTKPGVVRGFDAMYVPTVQGMRIGLIAGDAHVPFRTSARASERYSDDAVALALADDFAAWGPPLVLRMDRAKQHQTPAVRAVLDAYGVLLLHGPPHHPRYYGQLERQNREHRAWLDAAPEALDALQLDDELAQMLVGWNCLLPRRSLGWQTANDVWQRRPRINDDRVALREEVQGRAVRIAESLDERHVRIGLHQRLAIEKALAIRGYLECKAGGWC